MKFSEKLPPPSSRCILIELLCSLLSHFCTCTASVGYIYIYYYCYCFYWLAFFCKLKNVIYTWILYCKLNDILIPCTEKWKYLFTENFVPSIRYLPELLSTFLEFSSQSIKKEERTKYLCTLQKPEPSLTLVVSRNSKISASFLILTWWITSH